MFILLIPLILALGYLIYWGCTYLKFGEGFNSGENPPEDLPDFPDPASPHQVYDWEYEENKDFYTEWAEIQESYRSEILSQLEKMYERV